MCLSKRYITLRLYVKVNVLVVIFRMCSIANKSV